MPTRRTQNRKWNSLIQDNAVHMLTPRTKRRKLDEDGIVQQPQEEYGLEVIQSRNVLAWKEKRPRASS